MKSVLTFALSLVIAAGAASASVDYTTICNSSKLLAGDRHECRVQMTAAAEDEAKRAEINRVYTAKIARLLDQRGDDVSGAATIPSAE